MELKRVLGAGDAAWLVAGNMIGAGIFYTPGLVAGRLPGMVWPLAAWALGGLLALFGAAVYGELGSRFPQAGGDYQFLSRAFGPVWGFVTGWAAFLFTFAAATAAMVIVVVDYVLRALPLLDGAPLAWRWLGGPVLALLLTWTNVAGARIAGRATAWLTALPVAGMVLVFGGGLIIRGTDVAWPAQPLAGPSGLWPVALGAAMVPIFFSYTGWNVAAYVAGEIRDPGRNLARALLGGTACVTLLYLSMNAVLLAIVPGDQLAGSTTAGADAARRLLGPISERVLSAIIAVAVLGTANVTLMAGSRIYYAMAVDGLAPRVMARVNRAGVPSGALWISGIWTAALTTYGKVEALVNWATLAILLLSSMTVAALFVFRRRDPRAAPYGCPGYPWVPIVYLVTCLAVAVACTVNAPRQSSIGLLLVGAGIPVYFVVRRLGLAAR